MQPVPLPNKISHTANTEKNHVLVVEPLYPGYGTTLGNTLRRVLLSSVPGAAVTAFKVRGVDHEFSTIPGVREDVIELTLNLKQLRLKVFSEEPVTLLLKAKGEGEVTAANIEENDQVEVVNKDLLIATLDDKKAEFEMEIVVRQGRGYVPVEQRENEQDQIGLIQVDAVYSPIRNVSYEVENVRVGRMTNYDKLTLNIDTDGSIGGKESMDVATRILLDHFTILLENLTPPAFGETTEDETVDEQEESEEIVAEEVADQAGESIEDLGLSNRALNALQKNGISTMGELKKYTTEELSKLEGLGEKSVVEIQEVLERLN